MLYLERLIEPANTWCLNPTVLELARGFGGAASSSLPQQQLALMSPAVPPMAMPAAPTVVLPEPKLALPAPRAEPKETNLHRLEVVAPDDSPKDTEKVKTPVKMKAIEDKPKDAKESVPKEVPSATKAADMLEQAMHDREEDKKRGKAIEKNEKNEKKKGHATKTETKVLKRPAAKQHSTAPTIFKKPAAASVSKVGNNKGPIPSRMLRAKWRPEGCSKCRWQRGCCDSCWVGRGYRKV